MSDRSRDIEIIKSIDAYLKGTLSAREGEELWIELLKNPEYLQYLETEIAVKSILRESQNKPEEKQASVSVLRQSWKWIAAAASVAILVVAINFMGGETQQSLQQLTLKNISMAENLAAPMVFRSQKTDLSEADSLMNVGFEAALSGNLARALEIYETVIQKFEQEQVSAQAHLNIGIIKYNNGEYETAAESFNHTLTRVEEDAVLEEKALWYIGNAYIKLDRFEGAREAITAVIEMEGIYKDTATRLLKKLEEEGTEM